MSEPAPPFTDTLLTRSQIDLSNCDREPIHIPGSIQPHGVLLAVRETDWTVRQVSANTEAAFGAGPAALLGAPLAEVLGDEETGRLKEVAAGMLDEVPHYLSSVASGPDGRLWERLMHRRNGFLILEYENWQGAVDAPLIELHAAVRATMSQLQAAKSLTAFCQTAAERLRAFTGFDRVMVYRFLDDGSGHVFAEARREDLEPFLGLHYPASDIPAQARELFRKSWLRLLPDTACEPTAMLAAEPGAAPLDMSFAAIRSISPIHMEYLQNMGVHGSMSISIVEDNQLWGLFACHHYSPKYVPHATRMACEFLASMLSLQVSKREEADASDYRLRLAQWNSRLREEMAAQEDVVDALAGPAGMPGELAGDGAAVLLDGNWRLMGATPSQAQLDALVRRLDERPEEVVQASRQMVADMPELGFDPAVAAGMLAVRLTKFKPEYLFWFRREYAQQIHWAGDPSKPVGVGPRGDRLTPRKSFELWVTESRGRSRPWQRWEVEAAMELRRTVVDTIVRRVQKLMLLNAELQRSNSELDSFAYVASHDLKEPLRGIRHLTHFINEDMGPSLPAEGAEMLATIRHLSDRMELLLDSLLHYSRVDRLDLHHVDVNMQAELEYALVVLAPRLQESGVEVRVPRPLPVVRGDHAQVGEILQNVLSNAVKYQDPDKSEHWLEVTWSEPTEEELLRVEDASEVPPDSMWKFTVRDNGIGIPSRLQPEIFRIFRRLHSRDQFGGGAGAGLTIARKIAQRHGGKLWLESEEGAGSSFHFTLPRGPA